MSGMINFYEQVGDGSDQHYNPNYDKYLIKHPFRCLISGASGGGKTNAVLNLIDKLNCFERFYLFVKMMGSDPLYDEVLVPKLRAVEARRDIQILMEYSCDLDSLPNITSEEINISYQNLFVFDDMLDEDPKSLKKISAYFTKMRKRNCSLVFIGQDYFQTPKPIRRNCNLFILTRSTSEKDLQQIHQDLAKELDFTDFKNLFREATAGQSVLVIDPMHPENKYRTNFRLNR